MNDPNAQRVSRSEAEIARIRACLETLLSLHGHRVTSRGAVRVGISEFLLFDAVQLGLARLERTNHATGISVYLIFG